MNKNNNPGNGKKIGDIVNNALQSGDLSKLKDLGPAVQDALIHISDVKLKARDRSTSTAHGQTTSAPQSPIQGVGSTWRGGTLTPGTIRRIPRGLPQIILGTLGLFSFGLSTFIFIILSEALQLQVIFIPLAVGVGVFALACAGLLGAGIRKSKLAGRVIRMVSLFQRKKMYTFDEMAAETGRTPKQIKQDLRKARAKGLLPEVRTDAGETCMMWGEDVYRQYLETEKAHIQQKNEAEERRRRLQDPTTADLELFRSEGESTIQKIHSANKAILGEEVSVKLSTLEDITARIFAYVERHPEKLPDTRKFLSYYLPTTLKLVEKYRQYEEMDYQPENVRQAKLDIQRSLDTINLAFTNLLESLFVHDTLDVSTDISVLEKVLEQEGLTGKKFNIDWPG